MENQTKRHILFYILFAVGVISGLTLTTLSTWADLEAANYGFSRRASARLGGLSCPVLMTVGESNVVSLSLENDTDGKIIPSILVEISSPLSAMEFRDSLELASGESARREWRIGPENVDLKRFIFVKALVYSAYPFPDRENTCGVFVLDLPGNGTVIAWGMAWLSLLGMGIGLNGAYQARGPAQRGVNFARPLTFLSLVVLLGLLSIALDWWMLGIVALVVSLLLVLIAAGLFIERIGK